MPEVSHPPGPEETVVGSYFVANYPPFSVWTRTAVDDAKAALQAPPRDVPLGLYLHIPFCRKRCHFCYFRVYTDKNARQVEDYLDLLIARVGAVPGDAGRRRPAAALRLLRRRHAVVPVDAAAAAAGRRLKAGTDWSRGRGSHVRVRAGHAQRGEARRAPRARRHAAQPRRRELRRSDPRAERPRPPLAGDLPGLRAGARARLPADQHRPDRRHARRDRRQLARVHRADARAVARQRDDLPDGAAVTTRRSAATC